MSEFPPVSDDVHSQVTPENRLDQEVSVLRDTAVTVLNEVLRAYGNTFQEITLADVLIAEGKSRTNLAALEADLSNGEDRESILEMMRVFVRYALEAHIPRILTQLNGDPNNNTQRADVVQQIAESIVANMNSNSTEVTVPQLAIGPNSRLSAEAQPRSEQQQIEITPEVQQLDTVAQDIEQRFGYPDLMIIQHAYLQWRAGRHNADTNEYTTNVARYELQIDQADFALFIDQIRAGLEIFLRQENRVPTTEEFLRTEVYTHNFLVRHLVLRNANNEVIDGEERIREIEEINAVLIERLIDDPVPSGAQPGAPQVPRRPEAAPTQNQAPRPSMANLLNWMEARVPGARRVTNTFRRLFTRRPRIQWGEQLAPPPVEAQQPINPSTETTPPPSAEQTPAPATENNTHLSDEQIGRIEALNTGEDALFAQAIAEAMASLLREANSPELRANAQAPVEQVDVHADEETIESCDAAFDRFLDALRRGDDPVEAAEHLIAILIQESYTPTFADAVTPAEQGARMDEVRQNALNEFLTRLAAADGGVDLRALATAEAPAGDATQTTADADPDDAETSTPPDYAPLIALLTWNRTSSSSAVLPFKLIVSDVDADPTTDYADIHIDESYKTEILHEQNSPLEIQRATLEANLQNGMEVTAAVLIFVQAMLPADRYLGGVDAESVHHFHADVVRRLLTRSNITVDETALVQQQEAPQGQGGTTNSQENNQGQSENTTELTTDRIDAAAQYIRTHEQATNGNPGLREQLQDNPFLLEMLDEIVGTADDFF